MSRTYIRRFNTIDQIFHLVLVITFLVQTATGFSRLFYHTAWGKGLTRFFGGYETTLLIHQGVGILMTLGFVAHIVLLICTRIDWKQPGRSIFGQDSLFPGWRDFKQLGQRLFWFVGSKDQPPTDRWTYWEKFDYFAVFWGLPLLAVTGFMLMFSVTASRFVPGWFLNIALLLHQAEAILAVAYIFIVHFYVGHLRPANFPMNEAMFAGKIPLSSAEDERPEWIERLQSEGRLEELKIDPPSRRFRIAYFIFGYAVMLTGLYLLVYAIAFIRTLHLH